MKKTTLNQIKRIIIEDELAFRTEQFEFLSKEEIKEEKESMKTMKKSIKGCQDLEQLVEELEELGNEPAGAYEMILEIMDKLLQKEILMGKLAAAGLKTNR